MFMHTMFIKCACVCVGGKQKTHWMCRESERENVYNLMIYLYVYYGWLLTMHSVFTRIDIRMIYTRTAKITILLTLE